MCRRRSEVAVPYQWNYKTDFTYGTAPKTAIVSTTKDAPASPGLFIRWALRLDLPQPMVCILAMKTDPCHAALCFPALGEPYDHALKLAADYIRSRVRPLGIIAAGSIIRGCPHKGSDLDLCVVNSEPWRVRVQKFFDGVPAEIFVNPPWKIEAYLAEEHLDGYPMTAHMYATGFVVMDADPVIARLRERAAEVLRHPPELSGKSRTQRQYLTADMLDDALDVAESDPGAAQLALGTAVVAALRFHFSASAQWQPKDKNLLRRLDEFDPQSGQIARAFFSAATLAGKITAAQQIFDRVVRARGFFEWETDPEAVPESR